MVSNFCGNLAIGHLVDRLDKGRTVRKNGCFVNSSLWAGEHNHHDLAVKAGHVAIAFAGLPGHIPIPGWQMLAIIVYAMILCLVVNDAWKVTMIKWRIPNAACIMSATM